MNSTDITAIIAALVPLVVAITSLVVAIRAKNVAAGRGAAAGVKAADEAVTAALRTPESAVRYMIAKVARSAAADHVQTLVQNIGLPFMPHAQEHQPLPVVPDEQPPLIEPSELPPATDTNPEQSFPMAPPGQLTLSRLGDPINPNRPK